MIGLFKRPIFGRDLYMFRAARRASNMGTADIDIDYAAHSDAQVLE